MTVEHAEPGTPQWSELAAPHLARHLFAAERDAVSALRSGLMLSNPLAAWAWRTWPTRRREKRGWARLAGLAAPGIADFPIVPVALADVYGTPRFTVAVCRLPIQTEAT